MINMILMMIVNSNIIGLDLSPNNTGFVVLDGEASILHYGTLSPPSGLPQARRIWYSVGMISVISQVYSVQEAAVEDYAYQLRGAGNAFLIEHAGAVKQALLMLEIRVVRYNISTIKKFATGFGQADKIKMAEALDFSEKVRLFRTGTGLRRKLTEHEIDAFFIARLHLENKKQVQAGDEGWPCIYEN